MAKKRFPQAHPFLALGLVIVGWILVPPAVKSLAEVSFYEFQAPAHLTASAIRDLQEFWSARAHSKRELIEAGRDLARLNALYEVSIHQNESLRTEVSRLERLLNLPAREGYRYEVARVMRRDLSGWWQQIVIRKGANYGIRGGEAVVFTGGVVGRVREVGPYTAVVDLLSSPNIRLAANFDGDNRPVAFLGDLNPSFGGPRGRVDYVPPDITASSTRPLVLITSGVGGIFPPGLPIGKVQRLELGPDGQFKTGEVLLDERLSALTEVAVLLPTSTVE